MEMTIERVNNFDDFNWLPILSKSTQEGYPFIERMLRERRDETFREDGEALFVVLSLSGHVIACGGYMKQTGTNDVGRIRHVYVLPEMRGHGVGTRLLEKIIPEALLTYSELWLYTDDASMFYERFGFEPYKATKVTHRLLKHAFVQP